ncbi:MAG: HAD family hydrolase, partial [Myxococcota bacterium]
MVERFARVYTPTVMGLAVAILCLPPLLLGAPFAEWLYRSLVLLVIACPCALVISTSVSVVAALAASARHGVLVRGGLFIEVPAHLQAMAFDKTGTLIAGLPRVVDLVALGKHAEREVLERAASMQVRSFHPLARAIVDHARENGVRFSAAEDLQTIRGKGATGRVDDERYWVGSHRYLEERGQETPEVHERLEAMSAEGRSVVVLGNERHVCGLISVA